MSRRAFDLDYMRVPGPKPAATEQALAPSDRGHGEGEPIELVKRNAADQLRRHGFSQDRIEAWFGYAPEPMEPKPKVAQAPEMEKVKGPVTPAGT